MANGYPSIFIQGAVSEAINNAKLKARALPPVVPPAQPIRVSIPFFGVGFHVLRRKARRMGVQLVAASSSNTVRSMLCSSHKHHLAKEQESGVVYGIKCSCGSLYVGETGRELQDRLQEHERGWKKAAPTSAFGQHRDCQPAFAETQVLHRQRHDRLRLLAESAYIRTFGDRETIIEAPHDASINRNAGTLLDDIWLPILRDVDRRGGGTGRPGQRRQPSGRRPGMDSNILALPPPQ